MALGVVVGGRFRFSQSRVSLGGDPGVCDLGEGKRLEVGLIFCWCFVVAPHVVPAKSARAVHLEEGADQPRLDTSADRSTRRRHMQRTRS